MDFPLRALVDTGVEVNVIRRGIVPPESLSRAENPIVLSAADASALKGGKWGVSGLANMEGREEDTKRVVDIQCPIHFYEANISA